MTYETYMKKIIVAKGNNKDEWKTANPDENPVIFDAAHLDIKSLIARSGSIAKFSRHFLVPYRTAQDWSAGKMSPPVATVYLIGYAMLGE